ncbi:MAG: glycosyltransferase family 2 protein [Rickettsiales bacterium]|jgi:hypothetical protein|nr:glycosyltransferase family 2 protein [Rickettsiales bacterium]
MKKIKKIAVLTMARNDNFFLGRWIAYYGKIFGEKNLYAYLDGLDQKAPAGIGRANVTAVPKMPNNRILNDRARARYLSDRAADLFSRGYDIVIATDSDEFIANDPKTKMNLAEYLSHIEIDGAVSALGLDVAQHLKTEPALDKARPFLAQRQFALIHSRMTKASVINRPLRWGSGWHRVKGRNLRIDPNLYLFHTGNADFDTVMAKFQSGDLAKGRWRNHFLRSRLGVIETVSDKKARDGDRLFGRARAIQTIFRPPFAWNKPTMIGLKWVVKIPERFKGLL